MPNVPNVPGVPRLSSYSANPFPLLLADTAALINLVSPSQWGIFLNGVPVIQPATALTQTLVQTLAPIQAVASLLGASNLIPVTASTIEFEFNQEWPLSNYPQEQGAFQSYNKVELPFDVKVKLSSGGQPATRQVFINTVLAIGRDLRLFDIQTPEMTFQSVNCTHIDWKRRATDGVSLIKVDLWFQQIAESAAATFTNTQQPGNAGQQGIGVVQPQTPTPQVQSTVSTTIAQSFPGSGSGGGGGGGGGGGF